MYWVKHDSQQLAPCQVTEEEAHKLNRDGWGVFWVRNEYSGERRLAANCTKVNCWFVEMDGGDKASQLKKLENSPLTPSLVVESKNGYHAYWNATDATPGEWKTIVRWGLVPYFDADPKATDILRLLRAPGFNHVKNPNNPFPVKVIWDQHWLAHSTAMMLKKFPSKEPERDHTPTASHDGDWHLDARVGLELLPTELMNGESFYLVPTSAGKHNIYRTGDNYSTGCWVDAEGQIGGNHKGTTLGAWLAWYGHSSQVILDAIKKVRAQCQSTE